MEFSTHPGIDVSTIIEHLSKMILKNAYYNLVNLYVLLMNSTVIL